MLLRLRCIALRLLRRKTLLGLLLRCDLLLWHLCESLLRLNTLNRECQRGVVVQLTIVLPHLHGKVHGNYVTHMQGELLKLILPEDLKQ